MVVFKFKGCLLRELYSKLHLNVLFISFCVVLHRVSTPLGNKSYCETPEVWPSID